jgi:hypothetical protein
MKKALRYFGVLACWGIISTTTISAQEIYENELVVTRIVVPSSSVTYNTVDSSAFIIRIQNRGPHVLTSGDGIKFNYTLSNNSGQSESYDTTIVVGTPDFTVGSVREYTLNAKIYLNGDDLFSSCASSSGSVVYPINTSKSPSECELFFVGLDEEKVSIDKAYFTDNTIHLSLSHAVAAQAEVYDITGKLIQSSKLNAQKKQVIEFNGAARGFYFLKILQREGSSSIARFIVN